MRSGILTAAVNLSFDGLAGADNQYVCAENSGAAPLIANRTAIGTWERFDLIIT